VETSDNSAVGAAQRLPKHLHDALGPLAGEDLVNIIDEIRADSARQLKEHKAWLEERFASIDSRFDKVEAKVDARFDRVDARFEKVEDRVGRLEVKLGEVQSNLMKWSFVFWVGAVTAIAMLAGVLER